MHELNLDRKIQSEITAVLGRCTWYSQRIKTSALTVILLRFAVDFSKFQWIKVLFNMYSNHNHLPMSIQHPINK